MQLTDDVQLTVVDVVDAGSGSANDSVFVPLALAQRLLGDPDRLSFIALQMQEGADVEAIKDAARSAGLRLVPDEA